MVDHPYTISKIGEIIHAEAHLVQDASIVHLATDSRKINAPTTSLFFALSGLKNGHDYIPELVDRGLSNFVIDQQHASLVETYPKANFLIADNVLKALQALAAYHRQQYNLEVIGITGSNGKTTIKEWLYQLLAPYRHVVRNPKSYNSQIGVPLSVWQISEGYDLGIFEAGISQVGEMSRLQEIIQPDMGILTHMGTAHDEGFESHQQKITEKLQLFKHCKKLIYNPEMLREYDGNIPGKEKFTWTRGHDDVNADLKVLEEVDLGDKTLLKAKFKTEDLELTIPFINEAAIENAIVCWATVLALNIPNQHIVHGMENLAPVRMRMELKNGIHHCSIIDDSYNSDVQSLEIALNFLNQQNQHDQKTLILSDIYQSGLNQEQLYRQVAQMLQQKNINKFIGVGESLVHFQHLFKQAKQYFFADTDSLLAHLSDLHFENEAILLKGSRSFRFERISKVLVQKAHETVLQINLNALQNNLNFYKSKLQPGVKLMAMVKAFSYGSGSYEIANLLQFNQVDYLAVAYADEGVGLRQTGISLPMMVMNPAFSSFDKIVENKLEPEIYSLNLLDEFLLYAKSKQLINYPVHLKIDTGMHRLGFEKNDLTVLCERLAAQQSICVVSILSHMVGSESAVHDDFSRQQIEKFTYASQQIEAALGYPFLRHMANTSAISRWPDVHFDMVRLGIGLYGVDGVYNTTESPLQPVATLRTSISQVKYLKAGDTVGYGRKGVIDHDGAIATVRIGYADGYIRAFGNGIGKMLIKGRLVPTIGNICMDMCMLDVYGLDVEEGDEVIVFNEALSIEDVAAQIGTIAYEILANVSQRVKRVYYYE